MKIILLQDVYKKGVAGDVVDVAPGFARNFLIPRGMAAKATPGSLRQAEGLRKQAEVRRAERMKEYGQIAERIQGLKLYFPVRAGETGKLYGSITPGDIADALKNAVGLEIDRRRIGDRPLRDLGEFPVPVRLDAGLVPQVQVIVHREGQDPRISEEQATQSDQVEDTMTAEATAVLAGDEPDVVESFADESTTEEPVVDEPGEDTAFEDVGTAPE